MDFSVVYLALSRPMGSERARTGTPQLSVVIPVFQVEAYLSKCLDSVLADPSVDIEVVAVDDCSPDASPAILAEYTRRDPRLRVVRLDVNVGLGQARNVGLDHARGGYVWFVDGDDWLPAGAVRAVTERLAAHRPDVLVIGHDEVLDDGTPVRRDGFEPVRGVPAPIRLIDRPELLRLAQSACTKISRRAYLTELGLRFRQGWYEDCSYSHPLLMAAGRIDVLETVCYHYRQRNLGGITKSVSDRHFEVFEQYDWLFGEVDRAAGAYDAFRPELFRLMINHYLVIVGNARRLPAEMRREFFRKVVEEYGRRLPAGGYPVPEGIGWLKHQLVRFGAYRIYATLRRAHRALGALRDLAFGALRIPARRVRPVTALPPAAGAAAVAAAPRAVDSTRSAVPTQREPLVSNVVNGQDRLAALTPRANSDVAEEPALRPAAGSGIAGG
jgi:CDP-glycerol glycerophosphotransferase